MTAKRHLALLLLVLAVLVGYLVCSLFEESAAPAPGDATAAMETVAAPGRLDSPSEVEPPEVPDAASNRSAVAISEFPRPAQRNEEAALVAEATSLVRLRAIVTTPFGEPLAGVLIEQSSLGGLLRALPGSDQPPALVHELGRTGPDGVLMVELALPRFRSRLSVGSTGHETVVHGVLPELITGEYGLVIIASPVRVIEGVVTDVKGTPLENAAVGLLCFEDFSERCGLPVPRHEEQLKSVITDSEGRFRFSHAPEAPLTYVRADAFGHEYDLVGAPDRGDASVSIPLIPTRQGETALRGHVVCADGSSAIGALVTLPVTSIATRVISEAGRFELPLSGRERDATVVHATLPGFMPAVFERRAGQPWPDDLELEFGERTLAIRGEVVDQEGRPLAGLQVAVGDGTAFGWVYDPGGTVARMQILEDLAAASGTAMCITAEDGAFQINGLLARPYVLFVQQPETLRRLISKPIEAGQSGVRLAFELDEVGGPLAGRVTDRDGIPISDIQVELSRSFELGSRYSRAANDVSKPTARTDADGRFRVEDCAYSDATLRCLGGVRFESRDVPLSELGDPLSLEIVLARNSPVRVDWAGGAPPGEADSLRLEAKGAESVMVVREAVDGFDLHDEVSLSGPKTPVFHVREGSYEVVLLQEGLEVERFPVEIRGSELQVLIH